MMRHLKCQVLPVLGKKEERKKRATLKSYENSFTFSHVSSAVMRMKRL